MGCKMNIKSNRFLFTIGKAIKADFGLLKSEIFRMALLRKRHLSIQRYLRSNPIRKLHLGCGPNELTDWLNTDLRPVSPSVIFIDIMEPLPLPDESFDYIYSEHLIEHISFKSGLAHLKECFRVLKHGGTIRISTPDIQFLLDYYKTVAMSEVQMKYLKRVVENALVDMKFCYPTTLMNFFMHGWGHEFIYDEEVLNAALKFAGFHDVRRFSINESEKHDLIGLERHGSSITEEFNILQSMIFEATKKS
jgi:predicted SAM-dependent methyltransferase